MSPSAAIARMMRPDSPAMDQSHPFTFAGAELVADRSGALWWPGEGTLVVADLHLEKGSRYAATGQLIPPYDSGSSLARLARLIERYAPERVVCLGDSFHDSEADRRLPTIYRDALAALIEGREWIWVCGNHDPHPPAGLGGRPVAQMEIGRATLRHEAASRLRPEVSGHYHPKASIRVRNRRVTGRCFVYDERRLVLPAFGAYTGGLSVTAPALRRLFGEDGQVLMIGARRMFAFPLRRVG